VCIPGLSAVLGGYGTDSVLEYIPSDAHELLRQRSFEALGSAMLICCRQSLGMLDWGPGFVPQVNERGGRGKQVAKLCLPVLIVRWRSDDMDYSWD
jgi:hypothetical protein